MNKRNNFDFSQLFNTSDGSTNTTDSDIMTTGNKSGNNGIWSSLFSNLGGIFGGIGSVVQASTGNYPDVYYVEKEDNTGKYLSIGGVVLVVVIVLIFLLRK